MSSFFYVMDERARILFVDDDPILREFAQVHLASDRVEIEVAEDGVVALERMARRRFDLVLTDLEMPRMDGFGLLEALRGGVGAALPIIVQTGREDVEAIDRAFRLGATGFVTKPLNWRLLTYQLRFTLRAARLERDSRTVERAA